MQSAAAQIVTNIMTDEIDTSDTSTDEVCSSLGVNITCYDCFGDIILSVHLLLCISARKTTFRICGASPATKEPLIIGSRSL
mgnify:CR=1 FL=1